MNIIPNNWIEGELESICQLVYGKGLSTKDLTEDGYPVYGANGVIGKYSRYLYEDPQVIISCRGAASGVIHKTLPRSFITSNSIVLRPKSQQIHIDYFKYALLSIDRSKVVTGTAQPQITIENLKALTIPIAPLPEQKRIVAKLDSLFGHLDQLKARLENIPVLLKQFRQAVLTKYVLVGDNEGYLGDLFNVINGYAFKSSDYSISGIPLMKISNVSYGTIVEKDQKYLPAKYSGEYSAYLIREGDLLMPLTRPITNGELKIAFYNSKNIALLNQRVCIIRPIKAEAKYIFYLLQSHEIKQKITDNFNETLQPNLSPADLVEIDVNYPDINQQKEIVQRVETLFTMAAKIEASYQTLRERIDYLPQAILVKAFRGELVEGSYEMDEVLALAAEGEAVYGRAKASRL
jgi:type I restriction enzyme S subunit